jgi:AcrR family transcriptional regulator
VNTERYVNPGTWQDLVMAERVTRAEQQQRTRERLLDAAETLFGDRGIHQTSLDEIAAAAGLTKGAIYANFAGKKDLIAAILDRRIDDDEPPADRSAAGWARSLGESYEAGLARPEMRRFAMAFVELWLYGMRDESSRDALTEWMRHLRELGGKEAAALAGDDLPMPADQLAALLTALDIGVAVQHLIDPDAVPASVYTAGVKAILGGSQAGAAPG